MAMWDTGGNPAQNAYFLTVNLFDGPVRLPSMACARLRSTGRAMLGGWILRTQSGLLSARPT